MSKNKNPNLYVRRQVWYGLFMRFGDSNHEITRMQQGQIQKHQRSQIDFMLMKI